MTLADDVPDEVLVQRAVEDVEAFGALFDRYHRQVHAFAYRRTGDLQAADDITATTFEQAFRHLARFDGRDRGFRPWLFQIAANQIADHHRGRLRADSPRAVAALRTWHTETEDAFDRVDARVDSAASHVMDALTELSPRYQHAIGLRYLAGLSVREVAVALECSTPAASVVLHRALSALRRAMEQAQEGRHEAP